MKRFRRIRQRQLRILVSSLVGLAILGFGYLSEHYNILPMSQIHQTNTYKVLHVYDGDTIEIDMAGAHEKIRMIGIDTPETSDPRKAVQCFGQAASNFAHQKLDHQSVRLETDPLSTNRDRYDRLLRYVYVNDELFNATIIKEGYGFAYTSFPFTRSEEFLHFQKEARENNRGLWANCEPIENDYGGFTANDQ